MRGGNSRESAPLTRKHELSVEGELEGEPMGKQIHNYSFKLSALKMCMCCTPWRARCLEFRVSSSNVWRTASLKFRVRSAYAGLKFRMSSAYAGVKFRMSSAYAGLGLVRLRTIWSPHELLVERGQKVDKTHKTLYTKP